MTFGKLIQAYCDANLAINNVCWPPFTLVQHSPDVGLMSRVYITGWPPIGAIIHVGLQLGNTF